MATYGIQIARVHLLVNNLLYLEKVKTGYLKRALCVAQTTKSRLVDALANTIFFVEEIREKFKLPETPNFKLFRELQYLKLATINDNFLNTNAFKSEDWKEH
jgi:hypothetical protein